VSEPAKWLRELSEPWGSGERTKTAIGRAAKLSGLSYWRTWDIWYRKARRIRSWEIEAIARAIEAKNERDGRNELRELKSRISKLESLLASGDSHFHSPSIDHAREMARQLSDKERPVVRKR
jgi:hypothetical protein